MQATPRAHSFFGSSFILCLAPYLMNDLFSHHFTIQLQNFTENFKLQKTFTFTFGFKNTYKILIHEKGEPRMTLCIRGFPFMPMIFIPRFCPLNTKYGIFVIE